jgi:hypothetical protein
LAGSGSDPNRDRRKRTEEIRRGEQARALLEDALLTESFAALEQQYVQAWRDQTAVPDAAARELIWQHLQALRNVRGHLESVLVTGQMARQQLAELTGREPTWFD